MSRAPTKRNWTGIDINAPLCPVEATPAAALSLLAAAVSMPLDAATSQHVGCGRLFDGLTPSGPGIRYLGIRIPPGCEAGRAAITRCCAAAFATGTGSPPFDNLCWSTYGGTTGNDIITVKDTEFPNYESSTIADRQFDWGTYATNQQIVLTADSDVAAPTSTQDRLFELEPLLHPKVEPFSVTNAAGFSFVVTKRTADLTTL